MSPVHQSFVEHRLRVMPEQNETLRSHRNLRPFEFGVRAHLAALLCVFVRDDSAVFPCRRGHHQWRRRRPASPAAAATTLSATATSTTRCATAAALTATLSAAL